jgi:hypothetical protein
MFRMKNFRQTYNLSATAVGLFTFLIYLLTMSRGLNLWDSGEFIAVAYKMQIPHPPGAPFYVILARFFTLFSGNPENIAFSVNLLSVIAGSFTVFFVFKIIANLNLRILGKNLTELDNYSKIKLIVSSVCGALCFAFAETMWLTSTEAEVYPLSVMFTSLTLYLMLDWSRGKEDNKAGRKLILTCLILGISTGVHLLNILIIPTLVLIYFLKKYKYSHKNFAVATAFAVALLLVVQIAITGIPRIAALFELLFVNSLGMAFNSGLFFFVGFILIIIVYLIYYSHRKVKVHLNLIIVCVFVFLLGYSVYTTLLIRASSNPPINQNSPDNIFALISYMSREQYGNAPLIYGKHFLSVPDKRLPYVKGSAQYRKTADDYKIVNYIPSENYRKSEKMLLPRMWSKEASHISAYMEWSGTGGKRPPTQAENLRFLTSYQAGHMYFRYLMWNFAGKQNDLQSHGGPVRGNWITGIGFLDKIRLKADNQVPKIYGTGKKAFFLLPFLLGIIGIIYHFRRDKKFFWVLISLFFFTGLAIILYLNQHPYQSRERDYSYLASFMVFSVWIGLGASAIYQYFRKHIHNKLIAYVPAAIILILFPGQMVVKNYKYIDRSDNSFALNFAYNYLNSCESDAILFVSGDNETFPLWYLQEVRGYRTDVKIVNLALLNFDWYINQVKQKTYDAQGVPLIIPQHKYYPGQRDFMIFKENTYAFVEEIFLANHLEITEDYHSILNTFLTMLHNSGFRDKNPQDFNSIAYHYQHVRPHGGDEEFRHFGKVINDLQDEKYRNELMLTKEQSDEIGLLLERFLAKQLRYHVPLDAVLRFVFSDDNSTRIQSKLYDEPIDYWPVKNLRIDVDRSNFFEHNRLSPYLETYFTERIEWTLQGQTFTKSLLIMLEIIRANKWERPIYFSSTMLSDNYYGLDKYLYQEGWTYRLLPVDLDFSERFGTNVNAQKMYGNITENFRLSHLTEQKYFNENERSLLSRKRYLFARLAEALYFEGEAKKSKQVLDMCIELIPDEILPYDYFILETIRGYYNLGRKSIAEEISRTCMKNCMNELDYYYALPHKQKKAVDNYIKRSLSTIREIYELADKYNHSVFKAEVGKNFSDYFDKYEKTIAK